MGELWANFSGNRMRRDVPRSRFLAFFERERPVGEFSKIIANWKAHSPHGHLLVSSQERTLASPKVTYDAVLEHIRALLDDPFLITFLARAKNGVPRVEMSRMSPTILVKCMPMSGSG
jgi:hypothetical protein